MKLWIARDLDGTLVLSDRQPYLPNKCYDFFFFGDDASVYYLDKNMFPEVTFENSPMEVELVIKSQNKVTECYNCHEVIKFTENDVIDGWYVKCPCCGEEISILP